MPKINRHSRPKNGQLTALFVLGKRPKIEPINILSPSFRQKFSMIILSNIGLFFGKNSFLGVPGGFIIE